MKKIIVICGPTAVGKTGIAVELCKKFDGEIISADSQQVYRGMDIGTAKEDLTGTGVKCHLVDIKNPDEVFDVATFVELADQAINDIINRSKLPIIVGGTGFYIKALIEGLCEAPPRSVPLREELEKIRKEKGAEALHEMLKREDPDIAARLNPRDHQRVIRALEVKRLTGKSLLGLQREQVSEKRYDALKIGLNTKRVGLYQKINKRVDQMIERGLIDEVRQIVDKYGYDLQSLKAVGYKEIASYLQGNISLDEAISLTKRDTRRFAKRQLTWFRADPEIEWSDPKNAHEIEKIVATFMTRY